MLYCLPLCHPCVFEFGGVSRRTNLVWSYSLLETSLNAACTLPNCVAVNKLLHLQTSVFSFVV